MTFGRGNRTSITPIACSSPQIYPQKPQYRNCNPVYCSHSLRNASLDTMTPWSPETANRRVLVPAHGSCLDHASAYMTSMAPTTPMAARPAASMPMRAALPSDESALCALPAASVAEVPAFLVVVGPAVPAVERTVPLLASVA